jgi:hypothetical protein
MYFSIFRHDFYLDYYLCKDLGLIVDTLTEDESDMAKHIVDVLESYERRNVICKKIEEEDSYYRTSFIRLYV